MAKLKPVFEEERVNSFLNFFKGKTEKAYRTALKIFLDFYREKHGDKATISEFLKAIYEDWRRDISQQERIAENTLQQFINYLSEKGKSPKTISTYIGGIQSFLKYCNIPVSTRFIKKPYPVPLKKNSKIVWSIPKLKKFVESASNYRDKAIIMCLFQSGLGVNELCSLNYGDIKEEYEAGVLPLCVNITRKKSGVQHYTFFGRDAVFYLRRYLETRGKIEYDEPLFLAKKNERITPASVEMMFKRLAKRCDFIPKEQLEDGYNPARPHSLRTAFRTILSDAGLNENYIEFFMGHAIPEQKKAYLNKSIDSWRETYQKFEEYLSIEKTSREESLETIDQVMNYIAQDPRFQQVVKEILEEKGYKKILNNVSN